MVLNVARHLQRITYMTYYHMHITYTTYFRPMFSSYTSWNLLKNQRHKKGTFTWNRLKMSVTAFMVEVLIIQKPVHWFAKVIKFNIVGKQGNSTTVILFLEHVSQNLSVISGVQITYVLKVIWTIAPEENCPLIRVRDDVSFRVGGQFSAVPIVLEQY